MKPIVFLVISLVMTHYVTGQVIYDELQSEKLTTSRKLKIQLPRNYDTNGNKHYPLILVLDGDYLFEPVVGSTDYFSYWEDMPESIIVGVLQGDRRYQDCSYDKESYLPFGRSAAFFEFIGMELLPYINAKYRTSGFILGVGHDVTANFINYFMFKEPVIFDGYINLSPDYAPMMKDRILGRVPSLEKETFFYLATASDDATDLKRSAEDFDRQLNSLNNPKFHYYFDHFDGATHYSLVARAIPNALEKIFSFYRPISQNEFSGVMMKPETSTYQYLMDRYKMIEKLMGEKQPIRLDDLLAAGRASEEKKDWEDLREISKLADKQYPQKNMGDYFMARFYEETGKPRKAIRTLQTAYEKQEVNYITGDLLLQRKDQIKAKFGN